MKKLLIIGAGGHAKVVAEMAEVLGEWQQIAMLDDRYQELNGTLRWSVLGAMNDAEKYIEEYSDAIVALGNNKLRLLWLKKLNAIGFHLPVLIHPTAHVSPYASLAEGTVVMANATVQVDGVLGQACIVNSGSSVDHDCILGDAVHVSPRSSLGGGCTVGEASWLGIGCSIIQGIRIGDFVTVGAGAVVINDVVDTVTVLGVPAKMREQAKVMDNSMPSWPYYEQDELDAVEAVLRSGKVNYWTGEEGQAFEREFADFIGCKYGVALANGTLALEAAILALGISDGDEVIVPARTYIATASCVAQRGAVPVVADIDPYSGNLTVESIDAARTDKSKAIIAVHIAGWPCDMPAIMSYAEKHGLKVIEDCAQAHGAEINGRKVGSFGHAASFSFCQDKIMSTGGEGGMLVTNDEKIWRAVWEYKDHGRDYDAVYHQEHEPGHRWFYKNFGSNWRMTEMQAAIGRVQLRKLPEWLKTRLHISSMLVDGLSDVKGLVIPVPEVGIISAYYRPYGLIQTSALRDDWSQNRIIENIVAEGVACIHGSCCEIYKEKAFEHIMRDSYPLPNAQFFAKNSMALLLNPRLKDNDVEKIISVVKSVFKCAFE